MDHFYEFFFHVSMLSPNFEGLDNLFKYSFECHFIDM